MNINPYLRAAASHQYKGYSNRERLVDKYAWAIPNEEALKTIATYGPVIEIGAGTGYWAYLLQERGVDVLAYDTNPAGREGCVNGWFSGESAAWTLVHEGGAEVAGKHPERTLFLCWPPYNTPMAAEALTEYTSAGGQTVIYVGEGEMGCTGDKAFHELLDADWEVVECVNIPRWLYMHDYLWVYRRKQS